MKTAALSLLLFSFPVFGLQCGDPGDDDDATASRTCDDIIAEFNAEAEQIRHCTEAGECGQVLTGTSCGCTRNWVARLDADTTRFYALIDEANAMGCDLGLVSTCDCPATDGFACESNICNWNYVQ